MGPVHRGVRELDYRRRLKAQGYVPGGARRPARPFCAGLAVDTTDNSHRTEVPPLWERRAPPRRRRMGRHANRRLRVSDHSISGREMGLSALTVS